MNPLTRWWASQDTSRRSAIGVGSLAVILLMVVAIFTIFRKSADPVVVEVAPVPTVSATSIVTLRDPSPTDVGVPTIRSLKELKERFGDSPTANRGRLRIPGLGVDAPSACEPCRPRCRCPRRPAPLTSCSMNSRWRRSSGAAGRRGQRGLLRPCRLLVQAALRQRQLHRPRGVRAAPDRPAEFRPGTSHPRWPDHDLHRRVGATLSAHSGNWGDVLAHDIGGDHITIVTCDGAFNPATLEYSDRTVLRAVRTN